MTPPNKLTVEDLAELLSLHSSRRIDLNENPRDMAVIMQQLLDTMREVERLREALSSFPNCPQQYWSDAKCRAVAARQQAELDQCKHTEADKAVMHPPYTVTNVLLVAENKQTYEPKPGETFSVTLDTEATGFGYTTQEIPDLGKKAPPDAPKFKVTGIDKHGAITSIEPVHTKTSD